MTLTAPVGLVCAFFMVIKLVSINVTLLSSVGNDLTETAMGVQLILLFDDDVVEESPIPIPPPSPTSFPILPFPRRTICNEEEEKNDDDGLCTATGDANVDPPLDENASTETSIIRILLLLLLLLLDNINDKHMTPTITFMMVNIFLLLLKWEYREEVRCCCCFMMRIGSGSISLSLFRRVPLFADDAILGEQQQDEEGIQNTFYCCCNVAAILKSMTTLPGSTVLKVRVSTPKFEFLLSQYQRCWWYDSQSIVFIFMLTRATYVFFGNMFYLYSSYAY